VGEKLYITGGKDEFKEYQTEKLNSYIKGAKENIKLQKDAIRNYKKTLKDVEKISDLNKITTRYIVR
jgi:phenylacetate-coenzyme A ligase PaaK-like adenylate-forming protein